MKGHSLGDGECVQEGPKAIRVALETGEDIWIPKSLVHDDSEVWKEGQEGDVVVAEWWAEKEKLV